MRGPTQLAVTENLLRLVARMLAEGWVPTFEERQCGDGVQVWTVTWRRKNGVSESHRTRK